MDTQTSAIRDKYASMARSVTESRAAACCDPAMCCCHESGRIVDTSYNVLFLCTGNSARSILAESILKHKGLGRFHAYSAGSHPTGKVRPEALTQLELAGHATAGLRSKSWDEFAAPGAPPIHFIFTVCDSAANEVCPLWPGHPITAHWGIPDPASAAGTPDEIARAFRDAFSILDRRISLFLALPLATLEGIAMQHELDRIGKL